MNHRVSSIRNIRTIKALRGEAIRIDLGKTFLGELKSWMKREPNAPTHREFTIVDNRFLTLSSDSTKDFYTTSGVLIESVKGRWYFDVEQTTPEKGTKTIFTGTIYFEEDITGSNSVVLGGEVEPNTVEFFKTNSQEDPNNSQEASDFLLDNFGKQLFWQVDILATNEIEAINEQYWYSYKNQSWINLISSRVINLSFEEELLNYTYFNTPVFGVFLQIPEPTQVGSALIQHNLSVDKYLKHELVLSNETNNNNGEGTRLQLQGSELQKNNIEIQNIGDLGLDNTRDFLYIEYTKDNSPILDSIFNNQFNNIFS